MIAIPIQFLSIFIGNWGAAGGAANAKPDFQLKNNYS
jgi:hypothetical protein